MTRRGTDKQGATGSGRCWLSRLPFCTVWDKLRGRSSGMTLAAPHLLLRLPGTALGRLLFVKRGRSKYWCVFFWIGKFQGRLGNAGKYLHLPGPWSSAKTSPTPRTEYLLVKGWSPS